MTSRDWTAQHWPDLAQSDARRVAVLPLAATEQHGPHLPLGTDVLIAEAYLARVRALLPADLPVLILPVQPIGISSEHLAYPGTLTLPPEVALASWRAIGESVARAGIRRIVLVTSHGGNSAAMTIVAQELRSHHAMLAVATSWARLSDAGDAFGAEETRHGIHGGAAETSILLACAPHLVRQDAIADFTPASIALEATYAHLSFQRPAPLAWMAQDLHPSGAVGNATVGSAAAGTALLDSGAAAFCALLADLAAYDLAALENAPTAS